MKLTTTLALLSIFSLDETSAEIANCHARAEAARNNAKRNGFINEWAEYNRVLSSCKNDLVDDALDELQGKRVVYDELKELFDTPGELTPCNKERATSCPVYFTPVVCGSILLIRDKGGPTESTPYTNTCIDSKTCD